MCSCWAAPRRPVRWQRRWAEDVDLISSLAGRVPDPKLPVGAVRIGGFGGVEGMRQLAARLRRGTRSWTPPIRTPLPSPPTPPRCAATWGLAHLVLARPAWQPGDAILVKSDVEAAESIGDRGCSRVFLTTGRSGVKAFRDLRRLVSDPRRHRAGPTDPAAPPRTPAVARPVPLRRRGRPARRAPHRLSGDEEQRWRYRAGQSSTPRPHSASPL